MRHAIINAICSYRLVANCGGRHGANHGRNSFRVYRIQCLGKRSIVGWKDSFQTVEFPNSSTTSNNHPPFPSS